MLGQRLVQCVTVLSSFVRFHSSSRTPIGLKALRVAMLAGATLTVSDLLLSSTLFAQLTLDPIAERIRIQLEARKPPPEPLPPLTSVETTVTPPVDANADPANDPDTPASDTASPTAPPAISLAPPPKPVKFVPPKLYVGKELLRAPALLTRFYEGRTYQPAWTSASGPLPQAEALVTTIQEEAGREGLRASDYHLAKIKAVLADVRLEQGAQRALDPTMLADLDFLLTDAFFLYGVDASLGQVNPELLDEKWFTRNDETDLVPLLYTAVSSNQMVDIIRNLPPKQPGYTRLREALARHRDIVAHGGWPSVPAGPALALGATGERVAKLRARLLVSGDLRPSAMDNPDNLFDPQGKRATEPAVEAIFDQEVEQAVQKFQRRHRLTDNGVVSSETLAALNISAETRVRQIIANMARWRSLPQELGRRYIAVNVPDFTLEVIENEQPVMDMKVVVGKMVEDNATPTFSAKMTYVVLNPYWYVPKTIAEKELWPLHQRNPSYFGRNNFDVRRIPIGYKQVPDPAATDGSTKSVRVYDYVIRQGPGPKNALGRVKFMFPNPYSVYLHDTPAKSLFNRTVRAFSHGCIRIEKPVELAEYLLRDSPKWNRKAIDATLRRSKEQTVYLTEPLPVYIQYWTAWIEDDGELQFRNDIYRYDRIGPALRSSRKAKSVSARPRPKIRKRAPSVEPPAQPAVPAPIQASADQ
jgi:L,D-transpeptidase YcbB